MSQPARKRILVCAAWPYANATLHLGHMAGCYLPADIFARYHRLLGNDVLMVSGSDEHGTPVTVTAESEGTDPATVAERFHRGNSQALLDLDISFDLFTRTTTDNHREVAQRIFKRLDAQNYFEKRVQRMPYCEPCNRFLPDRLVNGRCPHCGYERARGDQCENCGKTLDPDKLFDPRCAISGDAPVMRDTEHLFFKLSAFAEPLLEWLATKDFWRPGVIHFSRNYIEDGLLDRPVTRDMTWGIPVPLTGYDSKRIYVWFEAVMGYLSASIEWSERQGRPGAWKDWWQDPEARSYYFLGKDNIPFHTIIWPAILLAHGDLNLPYDVPANEFLNLEGAKFSKSAGVGVTVKDVVGRFQVDAVRYYLTSAMPETRDSNWSWEEMLARVNDELVGTFGNLCHRTLTFTRRTLGGVPALGELDIASRAMLARIDAGGEEIGAAYGACEFRRALRGVMALAQAGNQYFDHQAPWKLKKTDPDACATTLHVCLRAIQALAVYTAPITPAAALQLWAFLGRTDPLSWEAAGLPLPAGQELPEPAILFQKLEAEEIVAG